MKIEKGIQVYENDISDGYGVSFWRKFIGLAEVGDSILLFVEKSKINGCRAKLDKTVKILGVSMKFKFKKWDNKSYRVWRIS